jgi:hypothetical protein
VLKRKKERRIQVIGALTLFSGLQVAFRMRESHIGAKPELESIPAPG